MVHSMRILQNLVYLTNLLKAARLRRRWRISSFSFHFSNRLMSWCGKRVGPTNEKICIITDQVMYVLIHQVNYITNLMKWKNSKFKKNRSVFSNFLMLWLKVNNDQFFKILTKMIYFIYCKHINLFIYYLFVFSSQLYKEWVLKKEKVNTIGNS